MTPDIFESSNKISNIGDDHRATRNSLEYQTESVVFQSIHEVDEEFPSEKNIQKIKSLEDVAESIQYMYQPDTGRTNFGCVTNSNSEFVDDGKNGEELQRQIETQKIDGLTSFIIEGQSDTDRVNGKPGSKAEI